MLLVLHRSAHGTDNLYGCGEFNIRKYALIVCKVLSSQDGLFGRYIYAFTRHKLHDTIRKFHDITSLPNVMGAIDGTHISLSYKPQWDVTPMSCDFFNKKKFHSVLLQAVCNSERFFFGMIVHDNRVEYMMLRNFPDPNLTHNYEDEIYCLIWF